MYVVVDEDTLKRIYGFGLEYVVGLFVLVLFKFDIVMMSFVLFVSCVIMFIVVVISLTRVK